MNECAPRLAAAAADLLAPSLAAAFLGALAFIAWWLWLRRTDPLAAWAQERRAVQETLAAMRKREEEFRAEMTALAAAAGEDRKKWEQRLGSVEMKVSLR